MTRQLPRFRRRPRIRILTDRLSTFFFLQTLAARGLVRKERRA